MLSHPSGAGRHTLFTATTLCLALVPRYTAQPTAVVAAAAYDNHDKITSADRRCDIQQQTTTQYDLMNSHKATVSPKLTNIQTALKTKLKSHPHICKNLTLSGITLTTKEPTQRQNELVQEPSMCTPRLFGPHLVCL